MEQTIYSILVSVKENWLIIILMSSNQSAIVNFLEKSFCYSIHCWIMVQKNDFYKILWILEWCSIYFKCGKSFLFSFSLKWSLLVFLFPNVLSEIALDWMSSSSLIFLPKTKDLNNELEFKRIVYLVFNYCRFIDKLISVNICK